VAALDAEAGVISPGGVGYDINCGVRLLKTNLTYEEVSPYLPKLLDLLFQLVPSGLGSKGKVRLSMSELDTAVTEGVNWAIKRGYGWPEDAEFCEERGCMEAADVTKVSTTAKSRGLPQLGSLGSGNHYLEIQKVDKIFDQDTAKKVGIEQEGQITVMIHTGSRGYGHQVCSDYLRVMERATHKHGIRIVDRELVCAPGNSQECRDYFGAMAAAANYAWCNRQMITHWTREAFERTFGRSAEDLDMHLIYDVAHNIAKLEEHEIEGRRRKVWVHRKGATRAFPPGHEDIPAKYKDIGQPVLVGGSMQDCSHLLTGTEEAMKLTFGSTAHGAGRLLSRAAATKRFWGSQVKRSMEGRGILVKCASMAVLAEEAGPAYKPCDGVVSVCHNVGFSKKIVRLVPVAVTKG
jgi:tRNA-splicing ligase RtcB